VANALATNLVNAAQKTLTQAQQSYPRQNVVISGLQPVNSHNVACGTFPQDAPAAQQFTSAMSWAMNACQTAAQQALEACQYIASYNPSASQYVAAASEQLLMLQGSQQSPGYLTWALLPDWSNCSNTNGGQCDAGAISCQPGSDWITYTLLVLETAQQAVSMAQQALSAPSAPTATTQPPTTPAPTSTPVTFRAPTTTPSRTTPSVLHQLMPGARVIGMGAARATCCFHGPMTPAPTTHRCTAGSATKIAQQIDPDGAGFGWRYVAGMLPSATGQRDPRPTMKQGSAQVTTEMGPKTIPFWTDNALPGGGFNRGRMALRLVLQCPYTGELFQFFRSDLLSRGLGATPPPHTQTPHSGHTWPAHQWPAATPNTPTPSYPVSVPPATTPTQYNSTQTQIATSPGSTQVGATQAPGNSYSLRSGTRVRATVSGGGATLPAIYGSASSPLTPAVINANPALVGMGRIPIQVAAVSYPDGSTLQVDFDYCGSPQSIPSPWTLTVSGVAVTTSLSDAGPSPAGICPAPSSSNNTPYYVAGGVVLAATAAALAWLKWGRKKKRGR